MEGALSCLKEQINYLVNYIPGFLKIGQLKNFSDLMALLTGKSKISSPKEIFE